MFNRHRLVLLVAVGVALGFYLGTFIDAPRPPQPEVAVQVPGREGAKPVEEMKAEVHSGFWADAEQEVRAEAGRAERRNLTKGLRLGVIDAPVDPRYAEAALRERRMQTGEYDKLVAEGLQPARYPAEKRKVLYAEFARGARLAEPWSLVVPFDDLGAAEMDEAVATLKQVESVGPASLTPAQRALLLKAGAREVFKYIGL